MTLAGEAGTLRAQPGAQFPPLGATPSAAGTTFAVASSVAEEMTLCLFDEAGRETQIPLPEYDAGVWHGFVPGVGPGQAYGYRACGRYDPASGLRCNPAKLLLDPYARAIGGEVAFGPEVLDYAADNPAPPASSTLPGTCRAAWSWTGRSGWTDGGPCGAGTPTRSSTRCTSRGSPCATRACPPELRGTYAGLAHEAAVAYLADLGVTAVELLPVHQNVPEAFLPQRGLTNYWGYNTIGYFAPHHGYSAAVRAGPARRPGRRVQGHGGRPARGRARGAARRRLQPHRRGRRRGPDALLPRPGQPRRTTGSTPATRSRYVDTTGCGNSLNAGDPVTLQLIMDSLRYWLTEMHVDGFRFDLAPTLAREEGGFDQVSAFFDLVSQDPVVSHAKLIAEPWDVGQADSYDLGRFPPLWREWNGKYRDSMRDFWRSHQIGIGEFATRFCGSSDLYGGAERRRPTASVNLITVHDGFTLADLVSYNDKHNEANGESNRDGTDDNRSWNCGAEGSTTDPDILALRGRQARAMLTTLLLSFGVPMLLGGDERGRTQQGNNNAYCQDNEITWFDWAAADDELLAFTRRLIAFRAQHPVFRRRRFLAGKEASELGWFTSAGSPMSAADWADPSALSLAIYLDGSDDPDRAEDGTAAARRRLPGPVQRLVGTARIRAPGDPSRAGVAGRDRQLRSRGTSGSAGAPRR